MTKKNEVQIVPKVIQAKNDICCIDIFSKNIIVIFNVKKNAVFVIKYFILIWGQDLLKINNFRLFIS